MSCAICPCPTICLASLHPGPRFAYMCRRAESGSELELRSIRERSAIGIEGIEPGAAVQAVTTTISSVESIAILKRMRACPHRSEKTDCGCGGMATCKLGKGRGGLVNHHDCFACLEADSRFRNPP